MPLFFLTPTALRLRPPHPALRPATSPRRPSRHAPRMDVTEPLGESLVHSAMLSDARNVQTLLSSGAPPSYASQKNASNMTALMWAASEGSISITEALLASGADPNSRNSQHQTALIYAFENIPSANPRPPPPPGFPNDPSRPAPPRIGTVRPTGHATVAELLVSHGADLDVRTTFGETLLHLAARKARVDWVDRFISNGVRVDERSFGYLQTALHLAAREGHAEVAERLLNAGADVDATSRYGWTPLVWAAACASVEVVKVLVEAGADVNVKVGSGGGDEVTTPLLEARRCAEAREVSRILIAGGAF